MPYLKHYDIFYYQAAIALQRLHRKEQGNKEKKLSLLRSKKMNMYPQLDDDAVNRVRDVFEMTKEFVSKKVYEELFANQQANKNLMEKKKKFDSVSRESNPSSPCLKGKTKFNIHSSLGMIQK